MELRGSFQWGILLSSQSGFCFGWIYYDQTLSLVLLRTLWIFEMATIQSCELKRVLSAVFTF